MVTRFSLASHYTGWGLHRVKQRAPVLLLAKCLKDNGAALLGHVLHRAQSAHFTIVIGSLKRIGVSTRLVRRNNLIDRASSSLIPLRGNYVYYALGRSLTLRLHSVSQRNHFSRVVVRTDNVYRPNPVTRAVYTVPRLCPKRRRTLPQLSYVTAIISTIQVTSRFHNNLSLLGRQVTSSSLRDLIVRRIRFYGVVLLGGTSSIPPSRLNHVARILEALRPHTRVLPYSRYNVSLRHVVGSHLFSFRTATASTT